MLEFMILCSYATTAHSSLCRAVQFGTVPAVAPGKAVRYHLVPCGIMRTCALWAGMVPCAIQMSPTSYRKENQRKCKDSEWLAGVSSVFSPHNINITTKP